MRNPISTLIIVVTFVLPQIKMTQIIIPTAEETGEAEKVSIAVVRRGCFWIVVVACELIMRVNPQVDTAEKKEKCSEEDECTFS
ncbi:hypothetical protein glysoja_009332 [Glycine soja]|nr:hypothetical protein glysoja_009332 [Glycine soja]